MALRVFTAEFGMGSGVLPLAMATRPCRPSRTEGPKRVVCVFRRFAGFCLCFLPLDADAQANRAISTGQLRGLLRFHLRPIDVVVYHGSQRDLVLKGVSRLDAFSGYPVRT